MKRMLVLSLTALALVLCGQQKASAWCDFNFSTGLNTSFASGGFRAFWGLVETSPGQRWPQGHCPQMHDLMPCGNPAEKVPAPTPNPGGEEKKGFFRNLLQPQNQPQYGYWNYPHQGYYQYPEHGFYQYPSAAAPVSYNP